MSKIIGGDTNSIIRAGALHDFFLVRDDETIYKLNETLKFLCDRLNDFGVDTYYSLLDDLHGIDGIVGGIPYYGYTKTGAGNDFRKKKLTERHPELNAELGIALQKSVQGKGGVYIVSDKVLETVAQAVLNKEIDSMKVIAC